MKTLSIVVLASLLAACAPATPAVAPSPSASAVRHRPGHLTRAELDTQAGRKLSEAIRALDAGLLMSRGEPIQVWMNGAVYGPSVLESLSANDVQEVARLSAADARQMFGDRADGAGLLITTRSR